jgi:nucleotide-binding universal stress UspA family protein
MTEHRESHLLARVRRYRIVVGLDLSSEYSEIVLEYALDQAARHDCPELHIVTVREHRKPTAEDVKQALWEHVYSSLETFNRHGTDWRARLHVRRGKPAVEIVELSAEVAADLVVIGRFGGHHRKPSRNSIYNRILISATCPTLVIGLPEPSDARQCPVCVAVRSETEGENWFCEEHHASPRKAPAITPMTVWSHGRFAIERAA